MKLATWLKIAAELPIGLLTAFFILQGIGEMGNGNFSGIWHSSPIIMLGLLMWFAWKRPAHAGGLLIWLDIVNLVRIGMTMNRTQDGFVAVLITGVPLLLIGLLLLLAAWKTPKLAL